MSVVDRTKFDGISRGALEVRILELEEQLTCARDATERHRSALSIAQQEAETANRGLEFACRHVGDVEAKLDAAERMRDAYLENLTAVQTRCTDLLQEVRDYRPTEPQKHVLADVIAERRRQDARWGDVEQRLGVPDADESSDLACREDLLDHVRKRIVGHCRETGRETCCWRHVLEEETCEALCETDPAHLRVELVQLAAVACLWIEVLDRRARKGG